MAQTEKATATSVKKVYTSPELIEYGDVAKLTLTGGLTTMDGTGGHKKLGG
ncbi:MAG: lasso RiPP family leader peptide-containing protein [Candidatus Rokubacteria bacterium]|nr:lasso RiPP family leader peptide-containing protein [Candidatus Rokubacteria bacterium]